MGEPSPKRRRPLRQSVAAKVGGFGAACLALIFAGVPIQNLCDRLHRWWWTGYDAWPSGGTAHRVIDLLGHGMMQIFPAALMTIVVGAIVLAPLGMLARTLARARMRAGNADPIAPARRWTLAHPRWVAFLTAALPAAWSTYCALTMGDNWRDDPTSGYELLGLNASFGIVGVFAAVALTALVRSGVRSFVAPILDDAEPQHAEVAKGEITFDAVAVTAETRAAVMAMLALNVAALALALSSEHAFRDPKIVAVLVAYAALAFGGAALFRHASKIAVGVDGVLVKGTSRTRFFAYRDLDAARVDGGDLELVHRDRVVLRLQLHGEDASKRSAVLGRIRDAIDRVKEGRGAVSAQLVSSATAAELARAAGGGADYRGAALTRDQLWALVEGPEIEETARRAAAEALAKTSGPEERARLRVAAEHCAAPAMRVALERLAEAGVFEDDALEANAPAQARRSA